MLSWNHRGCSDMQKSAGNQSDGSKSLLDIAEMAELPFDLVHQAAEALLRNQLLEVVVW